MRGTETKWANQGIPNEATFLHRPQQQPTQRLPLFKGSETLGPCSTPKPRKPAPSPQTPTKGVGFRVLMRACLVPGRSYPDDARLAPTPVGGLQGGPHDAGVSRGLERVVHAPLRLLHQNLVSVGESYSVVLFSLNIKSNTTVEQNPSRPQARLQKVEGDRVWWEWERQAWTNFANT